MQTIVVLALFSIAAGPPASWQTRFPSDKFLTGLGEAKDRRSAELAAAAELAKKISVRIEQNARDLALEKDGQYRYELSAQTVASTDVRLSGLEYVTHREGATTHVLAYLDRGRYASTRRADRDRSLAELNGCFSAAKKGTALAAHLACKKHVAIALEHASIARAVDSGRDDAKDQELLDLSIALETKIAELSKSTGDPAQAADALAQQLKEQGLSGANKLTVPPLTYGTSPFTSSFGRQMALELERAVAAASSQGSPPKSVIIRGTYTAPADRVRVLITARDVETGAIYGGAEASFPKSSLAKGTELVPVNLKDALAQDRVIGAGELIDGKLRLEVWTNKGEKSLLFAAGEELKIYFRVNQPAYVRLVYLLASGAKVPIEQAYFVDASKVNQAIEYPSAFEISAPFGVEQIFAVAFTQKPDPLPVKRQIVGGEEYEVVAEVSTLVKHRGLKKKDKALETAEVVVSMTTVPR